MDKIEVSKSDDITTIMILVKCSISEYKEHNLPLLYLVKVDDDTLDRQKIFLVGNDYTVVFSHRVVNIIDNTSKFKTELFIDREHKSYLLKQDNGFYFDSKLSSKEKKKEALDIACCLLEKIRKYEDIRNTMYCYDLYDSLSIIPDDYYYPLISNELITLSWPYRFNATDINIQENERLDIILNSTRENIGNISFAFSNDVKEGFTYDGNVSYNVKEEFRNNGYATMALALLKELLKNNKKNKCGYLYISTVPENIYSQKVALKNGGELSYCGLVPTNDSLYFIGGIKEINVYKIKL